MEFLKDAINFVKNIFTIAKTWFSEFYSKYAIKNIVLLGVALYLWFGLSGGFWAWWGWAVFFVWVGINIEAFGKVYRELKEKHGW